MSDQSSVDTALDHSAELRLGDLLDELARRPEQLTLTEIRPDALRARRRHQVRRAAATAVPMAVAVAVAAIAWVGSLGPRATETVRGPVAAEPVGVAGHAGDEFLDAVRAGAHDQVTTLIASGADPNRAQRYGMTPILIASVRGDVAMAEVLHEAGARLGASNQYGESAIGLAASNGHGEMVRWLAERGLAPDRHPYTSQVTPLMRAVGRGDLTMAEVLVQVGADPALRSAEGRTVHHFALDAADPVATLIGLMEIERHHRSTTALAVAEVSGDTPSHENVSAAVDHLRRTDPCGPDSPRTCLWP